MGGSGTSGKPFGGARQGCTVQHAQHSTKGHSPAGAAGAARSPHEPKGLRPVPAVARQLQVWLAHAAGAEAGARCDVCGASPSVWCMQRMQPRPSRVPCMLAAHSRRRLSQAAGHAHLSRPGRSAVFSLGVARSMAISLPFSTCVWPITSSTAGPAGAQEPYVCGERVRVGARCMAVKTAAVLPLRYQTRCRAGKSQLCKPAAAMHSVTSRGVATVQAHRILGRHRSQTQCRGGPASRGP